MVLLCAVVSANTGLARDSVECRAIASLLAALIAPAFGVLTHGYGRVSAYIEQGECVDVAATTNSRVSTTTRTGGVRAAHRLASHED